MVPLSVDVNTKDCLPLVYFYHFTLCSIVLVLTECLLDYNVPKFIIFALITI